jgi:hypothetical protein
MLKCNWYGFSKCPIVVHSTSLIEIRSMAQHFYWFLVQSYETEYEILNSYPLCAVLSERFVTMVTVTCCSLEQKTVEAQHARFSERSYLFCYIKSLHSFCLSKYRYVYKYMCGYIDIDCRIPSCRVTIRKK